MMYKLNISPKKGIIARTLSLAMLTGIALIVVAVMAACPSGGGTGDANTYSCTNGTAISNTAAGGAPATDGALGCASCSAIHTLDGSPGAGTSCVLATLGAPAVPTLSEAADGFINIAENTGGYDITVAPQSGSI